MPPAKSRTLPRPVLLLFVIGLAHGALLSKSDHTVFAQSADSTPRAPSVAEAEAMEARLQAAIRVNPSLASLHAALGELFRSQARLPEARDAFAEAVRLEPMNPEYRIALGRAHLALDEYEAAEINLSWGSELAPQDPAIYAGLGEALLGQDRIADAITALERAAELDPGNPDVEALLATARTTPTFAETTEPEPISLPRAITRGLTVLFAVLLSLAGLGLTLPLLAALFVLLVYLPRALLQNRKS